MVIIMKADCQKREIGEVLGAIRQRELKPRMICPAPRVVIGVVEDMDAGLVQELKGMLSHMDGVENIETFGPSWKLVSRNFRQEGTIIQVGSKKIGNGSPVVMAGPCAVESRESVIEIAQAGKDLQIKLRDQAPTFDPTTVPTPDVSVPLGQQPYSGMGVHMMRSFTDELRYRVTDEGENELILVKFDAIQT